MPTLLQVSTIAQTIQLSLAPVFMLAAIGQILNVLAGRLARVIDRARVLEERVIAESGRDQQRDIWELKLLDERMSIINAALSGDLKRLPEELKRMREQAVSEVGLVIVMQRQVMQLAGHAQRMGQPRDVAAWVRQEMQSRRLWGGGSANDWTRQLRAWGRPQAVARLSERLLVLQQAMMKASPGPALLLEQELLEIARVAARAS